MQALLAATLPCLSLADSIVMATFDGESATTVKFSELNDPVMGGKSTGTWSVDTAGKFGKFDGEVVNVPSLSAPGFIKAAADATFPDASAAFGGDMVLLVRSNTPSYTGFRTTFVSGTLSAAYACSGGGSIPFSRGCFKAKFSVPAGDSFSEVRIPLSSFSDKWSPATGEQTTTCATDADVCPTKKKMSSIKRIEVWAEGVAGKAHLEIQSISFEAATTTTRQTTLSLRGVPMADFQPPATSDTCAGPVQRGLRYNISTRDTPETVRGGVNESESLAEAVCCDIRAVLFAEPQFTFAAPDISLFTKMSQDGVTTFYDSVCGLPLFRAPMGRSLADFEADTNEHGWPSFRPAEVVYENVVSDTSKKGGLVKSKCGTHLGTYLPDDRGARWCMDLSCIAGNPTAAELQEPHDASLTVLSTIQGVAQSFFSQYNV